MSLAVPKKKKSAIVIPRAMVWLFILGYSVYLVEQSTYQNYRMNKDIANEKKAIATLEVKEQNLQFALVYYKSHAFKEIEARQYLNLQSPDEHVVALPQATSEPELSIVTSVLPVTKTTQNMPPYMAWWQLFFGPDK